MNNYTTEQILDRIVKEIEELANHPELLVSKDSTTFVGGLNRAKEIVKSYKDGSKD